MRSATDVAPSLVELFEPKWAPDPYPFYARLRDERPVYWDEPLQSWVISRYDDIVALSTDVRLGEDRVAPFFDRLSPRRRRAMGPLARALGDMMLFNDRPRHTHLRGLAGGAFSRSATDERRAGIQRRVTQLLDAAAAVGHMDVVADLSQPLTKSVIAELLGVPEPHQHLMDDWTSLLHEFFVQSTAQQRRLSGLRAAFDDMLRVRGACPGNDLVSHMLARADVPDAAAAHEMYANFLLVIDAGQVTTTYLIANAVRALASRREIWEQLRAQPELIPNAAHELMRYDSSVQFTTRIARAELEIDRFVVTPGEAVTLLLGSGNRDPARFADPDRLDPSRDARGHLSFGHGIHYCLGAQLGLAEIEIVIASLIRRMPDLRLLDGDQAWHDSINFRFLRRLPVRFAVAC